MTSIHADPFEALAARNHERVRALVSLSRLGVPTWSLYWAAQSCGQIDVFEAVAADVITSEEGAWLLMLRRVYLPWYVRLALWIFERSPEAPEEAGWR